MRFAHICLLLGIAATAIGQRIQEAAARGPGGIKMYIRQQSKSKTERFGVFPEQPVNQRPLSISSEFPARYFRQPLDHFSSTNDSFLQRYWVSTRHYKAGGPVIVLDGGETSGEDRLPFLDTGILDILASATNGLGIVLEHRYYGSSIPVGNFSTDALRWLNNAQAAADSANFMTNLKIEGINESIAAPERPWIYYGGSYAGARAAHMRVLYPNIVYGAIASSAVTHATLSNWEYNDIIRNYTVPRCRRALEHSIATVDYFLSHDLTRSWIKGLFGLRDLKTDEDFASVLQSPLGYWQGKNWDPAVGSNKFDEFCATLVGQKPHGWGDADNEVLSAEQLQTLGGVDLDASPTLANAIRQQSTPFSLFNYAKYVRENLVSTCPSNNTVEQCFGTNDASDFQDTSLSSTWRAWTFQVCTGNVVFSTEWGYFDTAPPDPKYPTIVSRRLTLEYTSRICKLAFPPGNQFIVPPMPNITAVNALGDFDIAADRLAFVDGEQDPWRPDTPHSEYATPRDDTVLRPFKVIPGGVHHWDENGLLVRAQEPTDIQKIHREEVEFVQAWLKDWAS